MQKIVADNLGKPVGVGAVSQPWDREGRTIFVADAHCDDGKRFVVHADEKLTAFLDLESAICVCGQIDLTSCTEFSQNAFRYDLNPGAR